MGKKGVTVKEENELLREFSGVAGFEPEIVRKEAPDFYKDIVAGFGDWKSAIEKLREKRESGLFGAKKSRDMRRKGGKEREYAISLFLEDKYLTDGEVASKVNKKFKTEYSDNKIRYWRQREKIIKYKPFRAKKYALDLYRKNKKLTDRGIVRMVNKKFGTTYSHFAVAHWRYGEGLYRGPGRGWKK